MAYRLTTPSILLATLAYATVLFHVTLAVSCPKHQSPVLDDKVAGSEVVIQGRVREQLKARPQDSSYTAEVEVQCVFKGGPLVPLVNVTGAGRVENRCVQTDLRVGRVYLVYLKRVGDESKTFTPTFTQDPAERKYLEELKYSCGLNVQLPQGISESEVCHPDKFVTDDVLDECSNAPCPVSLTAVVTASVVTCWSLRLLLF